MVRKTIFGVLAFWPLAMMALILISIFVWEPNTFSVGFLIGMVVFMAGWLLFILDVWRNERLPADKRGLWTAVLLFAGPYAMPFYFWFYIRGTEPAPAVPPN